MKGFVKDNRKARVIAFYLPQFHPVKENDDWWGPGFTEWNNVAKARPLFPGHVQPKIPADLGFYDLRIPEVRERQAKLAEYNGVEGFCYWHYWFGGDKRLLERPFSEVLASGSPNYPFCLGWANHDWHRKLWDPKGTGDKLLIKQEYNGIVDYEHHFNSVLLSAFKDPRYIKVDNKPLFVIYSLECKVEVAEVINCWNRLAIINGFEGIYFVAAQRKESSDEILNLGFDGMYRIQDYQKSYTDQTFIVRAFRYFGAKYLRVPRLIDYEDLSKNMYSIDHYNENVIPMIMPRWDHSPRSGTKGFIVVGSTPSMFKVQINKALQYLKGKRDQKKLLFLVSWNEWGEGNYMEPDEEFGHGFLEALKSEIVKDGE